jgi:hypothetical protein
MVWLLVGWSGSSGMAGGVVGALRVMELVECHSVVFGTVRFVRGQVDTEQRRNCVSAIVQEETLILFIWQADTHWLSPGHRVLRPEFRGLRKDCTLDLIKASHGFFTKFVGRVRSDNLVELA